MPANAKRNDFEKAANVVRDAGGEVIGRTRLQKVAYLLELGGVGEGFVFEYRHYGPYSEELSAAAQVANLLGLLTEKECRASWGGKYSKFSTDRGPDEVATDVRKKLAWAAANADAVVLELAATAAFLRSEGAKSPWEETAKRKPEKATSERLSQAKTLYESLRAIDTPQKLPSLT